MIISDVVGDELVEEEEEEEETKEIERVFLVRITSYNTACNSFSKFKNAIVLAMCCDEVDSKRLMFVLKSWISKLVIESTFSLKSTMMIEEDDEEAEEKESSLSTILISILILFIINEPTVVDV